MSTILIPASSNNQRSPWRLPMSEHCARLVTLHLVFSRPRLVASPVPCGLRTLDRISALTSSALAHFPKRLRCNVSSRFAVPPTCSRKCSPKSFRKLCCRIAGHDQCACAPCAFVYMYRSRRTARRRRCSQTGPGPCACLDLLLAAPAMTERCRGHSGLCPGRVRWPARFSRARGLLAAQG
jgi:hypothetical protein